MSYRSAINVRLTGLYPFAVLSCCLWKSHLRAAFSIDAGIGVLAGAADPSDQAAEPIAHGREMDGIFLRHLNDPPYQGANLGRGAPGSERGRGAVKGLKRGELVTSVKGAQGGYLLSAAPGQISVLDVLTAVETGLFDKTEDTVAEKAPEIEFAMRESAFSVLDDAVSAALSHVSLEDLVLASEKHKGDDAAMYYI